jgi:hypothetical protein
MARKITYEQALVSHGWVALDPADIGVIEKLFKSSLKPMNFEKGHGTSSADDLRATCLPSTYFGNGGPNVRLNLENASLICLE